MEFQNYNLKDNKKIDLQEKADEINKKIININDKLYLLNEKKIECCDNKFLNRNIKENNLLESNLMDKRLINNFLIKKKLILTIREYEDEDVNVNDESLFKEIADMGYKTQNDFKKSNKIKRNFSPIKQEEKKCFFKDDPFAKTNFNNFKNSNREIYKYSKLNSDTKIKHSNLKIKNIKDNKIKKSQPEVKVPIINNDYYNNEKNSNYFKSPRKRFELLSNNPFNFSEKKPSQSAMKYIKELKDRKSNSHLKNSNNFSRSSKKIEKHDSNLANDKDLTQSNNKSNSFLKQLWEKGKFSHTPYFINPYYNKAEQYKAKDSYMNINTYRSSRNHVNKFLINIQNDQVSKINNDEFPSSNALSMRVKDQPNVMFCKGGYPLINKKNRNESKTTTNYKTNNQIDSNTNRSETSSFSTDKINPVQKFAIRNTQANNLLKSDSLSFRINDKNNINKINSEFENLNKEEFKYKLPYNDKKNAILSSTNDESKNDKNFFQNKFKNRCNTSDPYAVKKMSEDGKNSLKNMNSNDKILTINSPNYYQINSNNIKARRKKFENYFKKDILSFLIKRSELINDVIKLNLNSK